MSHYSFIPIAFCCSKTRQFFVKKKKAKKKFKKIQKKFKKTKKIHNTFSLSLCALSLITARKTKGRRLSDEECAEETTTNPKGGKQTTIR